MCERSPKCSRFRLAERARLLSTPEGFLRQALSRSGDAPKRSSGKETEFLEIDATR